MNILGMELGMNHIIASISLDCVLLQFSFDFCLIGFCVGFSSAL